jgi:hypothetical protein
MDVYRGVVDRNAIFDGNKLKVDSLRDQRQFWVQTVFVARIRTINGLAIDETLGRAEIQSCPVYVSN